MLSVTMAKMTAKKRRVGLSSIKTNARGTRVKERLLDTVNIGVSISNR